MRLATKTRYGVRAVFDIAYHAQGRPGVAVQAKDIAYRENIPPRYLEQIFQDLRRAGLVESKRGPRGGYILKREPASITLADVVSALQGPPEEIFEIESDEADAARTSTTSRHVTAALWQELAEHIGSWLRGVSIADMVQRARELGVPRAGTAEPMYFI